MIYQLQQLITLKMFKKIKLIFLVFMVLTIHAKAQSLEITPQVNYTIGGKIYARFGELNIRDSESYGISANLVTPNNTSFQIDYFYQPTVGEYRDYFNPDEANQNADLRISWFMVGVRKRFEVQESLVPFGGASIGLTRFAIDSTPTSYDEWALSLALQGGVNVYISKLLGLRFHTRILMPIQFQGFGFYAGTGGSGAAASAGTYFVQADFGAGLIIRLNNE